MDRYVYDGPVKIFNDIVNRRWTSSTVAPSKQKAESNLAYQYKKSRNLASNSNVKLDASKIIKE